LWKSRSVRQTGWPGIGRPRPPPRRPLGRVPIAWGRPARVTRRGGGPAVRGAARCRSAQRAAPAARALLRLSPPARRRAHALSECLLAAGLGRRGLAGGARGRPRSRDRGRSAARAAAPSAAAGRARMGPAAGSRGGGRAPRHPAAPPRSRRRGQRPRSDRPGRGASDPLRRGERGPRTRPGRSGVPPQGAAISAGHRRRDPERPEPAAHPRRVRGPREQLARSGEVARGPQPPRGRATAGSGPLPGDRGISGTWWLGD